MPSRATPHIRAISNRGERMRVELRLLSLACLVVATPAVAQKVQFAPFVAAYYSLRELGDLVDPSLQGGRALQNNATALGASVSFQLTDQLGVELASAYTFSDARVEACDAQGFCTYADLDGMMILSSVAARLQPRRSNFIGTAGLAVISRGGEVWEGTEGKTSFGGTVGAGVRAQVAPKFSLDFRASVYVYSFDPDGSDTSWEPALATDFLIRVGVPFPSR